MAINNYTPTGIVHEVAVDFQKRPVSKPIHVVQYDDTLPVLAVHLHSNGQPYILPQDGNANLRFGKPDHTFNIIEPLGCDESRAVLYFPITSQLTIFNGSFHPVVEINSGERLAYSSPINVIVDRNPVPNEYIESTSDYKSLIKYVTQAENAVAKANEVSAEVITSATKSEQAATRAENSAVESALSASSALSSKNEAVSQAKTATSASQLAVSSKNEASEFASSASASAIAANNSKTLAEDSAKESQSASQSSKEYATNARTSSESAKLYADNAESSAERAAISETNSASSATNAANSEKAALISKNEASDILVDVKSESDIVTKKTDDAEQFANRSETALINTKTLVQSYLEGGTGTRVGEDTDNVKYYTEEAKRAAQDAEAIAGGNFVPISEKGVPNGVATLDENGKLSSDQVDIPDVSKQINNRNVDRSEFGLAYISWTTNLTTSTSTSNIETSAALYANCDIACIEKEYPSLNQTSQKIIKRAKELNPRFRVFGYIQAESARSDFKTEDGEYAHLNPDGSWKGSTADITGCTTIYNREGFIHLFDKLKSEGYDGIFFDDWGYDWQALHIAYQMGYTDVDESTPLNETLNRKWIDLIELCHERGLSVITNGNFPADRGDWYTHLDENDIVAFESCMISSHSPNRWYRGQDTLYNYYSNYYATGQCKAKSWSLDYFPGGVDAGLVRTFEVAMALASGANYVSSGTSGGLFEKPWFMELFTRGKDRRISKMSSYQYILKCGNHMLEVVQDTSCIAGSPVTNENISYCSYTVDGRMFKNAYNDAGSVNYKMDVELKKITDTVKTFTEDSKRNAVTYHRMMIDDWVPEISWKNFKNYLYNADSLDFVVQANTIAKSAKLVKNDEGGVDYILTFENITSSITNKSFGIGATLLRNQIKSLAATGHPYEFGFSNVLFEFDDGYSIPEGSTFVGNAANQWPNPGFSIYMYMAGKTFFNPPSDESSKVGDPGGYSVKIPSVDETFTSIGSITVWLKPAAGQVVNGRVIIKNIYVIDLSEFEVEYNKTWYTNLVPAIRNVESLMATNISRTFYKSYPMFTYETTSNDSWGWSRYKFGADETTNLRGHRLEFGCESITFSNGTTGRPASGDANYAIGIGVNTNSVNTYRLYADTVAMSEVFGCEKNCVQFTIPSDATTLSFGNQSYGYPKGLVVTVKNAYLYDLDEDVQIRGKNRANSSIAICRINEDLEKEKPSNVTNALYITDKGRVYATDLGGKKVEIAGAIFEGARGAGFTGDAEAFGAAIYKFMNQEYAHTDPTTNTQWVTYVDNDGNVIRYQVPVNQTE